MTLDLDLPTFAGDTALRAAPIPVRHVPPRHRHVAFIMRGTAVQQGSMVGYASRNPGSRRGFVQIKADNEKELKPWRAQVAAAGTRAMVDPQSRIRPPLGSLDVALAVRIVFTFIRPASVKRPLPTTSPDVDKLARAVLDALGQGAGRDKQRVGRVIDDDARVVKLTAEEVYVADPFEREALPWPGVIIHVWEIS